MDMETIKSKEVLNRFTEIRTVPQTRFYTAIDLLDGTSEGETAGGYRKHVATNQNGDNTDGCDLNFEVIHRPAVMQYNKHIAPKVITPEANQDADAWKFGYRKYGLADAYENKLAGIYASHKPASAPTSL
jgi:hypothetical protein